MLSLSVDVEPDFPPHHNTFKGRVGLEKIVEMLRESRADATFFICAELLDRDSSILDLLRGFELGCHSFRHRDLTGMSAQQVLGELGEALEVFEEHGVKAQGFRAPYARVNDGVLEAVKELFRYDSSLLFFQRRYPGLSEVPLYLGGKAFGVNPALFSLSLHAPVRDKVYFIHPWEYGGLKFTEIAAKRDGMKYLGYASGNYFTNLQLVLDRNPVRVSELL